MPEGRRPDAVTLYADKIFPNGLATIGISFGSGLGCIVIGAATRFLGGFALRGPRHRNGFLVRLVGMGPAPADCS